MSVDDRQPSVPQLREAAERASLRLALYRRMFLSGRGDPRILAARERACETARDRLRWAHARVTRSEKSPDPLKAIRAATSRRARDAAIVAGAKAGIPRTEIARAASTTGGQVQRIVDDDLLRKTLTRLDEER